MAVEDLVDDFWKDVLGTNTTPEQAQAKWNAFVLALQARVAHFPKEAQDEVFLRAAARNSECMAIARGGLDNLRIKLGLPAASNRLAEVVADEIVRATVGQGVAALFRLFR